jgi:hypothetical protein
MKAGSKAPGCSRRAGPAPKIALATMAACVEGFHHLDEDLSLLDIGHEPLQGRTPHGGARETPVVVGSFR